MNINKERKLTSASRSLYTLEVIIIKFKTRKNAIVEYLDYPTRKNAIVEYLDYQVPKGNGDMQAAKR